MGGKTRAKRVGDSPAATAGLREERARLQPYVAGRVDRTGCEQLRRKWIGIQ
jgi:hypothetical protein